MIEGYDELFNHGKVLEDLFIKKREAELRANFKRLENMKNTKKALSDVSGITNEKVLAKLIDLEVTPAVLASLTVLPLIEVAWADGKLDAGERAAVLDGVEECGFGERSVDHALIEVWLEHKPSSKLLDAWEHVVEDLKDSMNKRDFDVIKTKIMARARKVAEAAGGILGLAKKVSAHEQAVLRKMEKMFG